MNSVFKSVLIAIGVTLVGLIFAALFGECVNGFSRESSTVLGMVAFSCFVTVVCTGLVLSRLNRK